MTRANRMNRRIVCFLVAVLPTVAMGAAHAGEGRREAKAHADRALREYNLGNFEQAITEFGKAYESSPRPSSSSTSAWHTATSEISIGQHSSFAAISTRRGPTLPVGPTLNDTFRRWRPR